MPSMTRREFLVQERNLPIGTVKDSALTNNESSWALTSEQEIQGR